MKATEKTFFDFALELYNQVRESHDNSSWKEQDSVILYIPVKNILDNKNIHQLHAQLINHFRQNN